VIVIALYDVRALIRRGIDPPADGGRLYLDRGDNVLVPYNNAPAAAHALIAALDATDPHALVPFEVEVDAFSGGIIRTIVQMTLDLRGFGVVREEELAEVLH
jgi:hypothetical protein